MQDKSNLIKKYKDALKIFIKEVNIMVSLNNIKGYLKILAKVILIIITFTLYANYSVCVAGRDRVYSVDDTPKAEAAVVLGARVYKNGALSQVLLDRMDTGIELYLNGKVTKLLLTGDHGQLTYDEVNAMRKYAISRGVPDDDIFMDHAGFSTYDSMYRAKEVFRVKKAVIVTQEFHLARALYIAWAVGLEASGVIADKREYIGMEYIYAREVLARTKAAAQVIAGSKPKYLGPAIPISGDGRVTKG